MGNDGGSIPSRSELVKQKTGPRKVQETKDANSEFAWNYCALSKAPLQEPLVADALGRIYNKDAVLQHLIDASVHSDITSLKDVTDLILSRDGKTFKCPVTGRTFGPKFIFLLCGHVMALEAIRHEDVHACLICSAKYDPADIIQLNATDEALDALIARQKRLDEAGLTHSLTKKKKKKRKVDIEEVEVKHTKKVKDEVESSVLKSLFHKGEHKDGFLTRGVSSRV